MMDDRLYTVYMHTNKVNGKKYIGITCRTLKQRWLQGSGYKHGKFKFAVDKYGWDGFVHEIIAENLNREDAMRMEIELIEQHKTRERQHGYNVHFGGNIRKGHSHSPETRKKISDANYNRSPEINEKIRLSRIGRKNSEETKRKMSKVRMGIKFSDAHRENLRRVNLGKPGYWTGKHRDAETMKKIAQKLSKPVICLETGAIYPTTNDVCKFFHVSDGTVSKWCMGFTDCAIWKLTFKRLEDLKHGDSCTSNWKEWKRKKHEHEKLFAR